MITYFLHATSVFLLGSAYFSKIWVLLNIYVTVIYDIYKMDAPAAAPTGRFKLRLQIF